MKRLVSFIIVIGLVVGVGLSSSEGLNWSSMTDDELLEIKENVDKELEYRGNEWRTIYANEKYIVGENIRAGSYLLKYIKSEKKFDYAMYIVFENEEEYPDNELKGGYIHENEITRMYIADGMKLLITLGDAYIKPAPELPDLFMD